MDVAVQYEGANLISCVQTIVFIYKAFVLRFFLIIQSMPTFFMSPFGNLTVMFYPAMQCMWHHACMSKYIYFTGS